MTRRNRRELLPAKGTDFRARRGTECIPPGRQATTITIGVKGDVVVEPDEYYFVQLSNPVGAQLGTVTRAKGTIINNDGG